MRNISLRDTIVPAISLFLSAGTLICCALPALFITLGMGAALAGFITAFPQIAWLSAYKIYIFSAAGIMLAVGGYMQWRAKDLPCPADPIKAKACAHIRRLSLYIYAFSLIAFSTGLFFAFIAPRLI